MIKKTSLVTILICILFFSAINASAYDTTLTITDGADDVQKIDIAGNITTVSRPNVDIAELSCVQSGRKVVITVKLTPPGIFEESLNRAYAFTLITTSSFLGYVITYSGIDWAALFGDEIPGLEGVGQVLIVDGDNNILNVTDYSGKDTDTLTIEFNLQSSTERVISISGVSDEEFEDYGYGDKAPDDFDENLGMNLNADTGDTYNAETGKSVTLTGSLDEGNAEDYEWLWVFDESSLTLTGHNPSHVFNIPDFYTGMTFVYDEKGSWGAAFFEVNVSGKSNRILFCK